MDISLISAFIGGVLALLSPCAALLLPAFFGSTVGAGSRLILHGLIFYVGMLIVLIPLGMGAGTLGALFTSHREAIVLVASVILIVLGIVQFFGFGFDPAKMLPGADAARQRSAQATGWTKTFLLGATSGSPESVPGPSSVRCSPWPRPRAASSSAASCSPSTGPGWSCRCSSSRHCGPAWAPGPVRSCAEVRSLSSVAGCRSCRWSPVS